MPSRPGVLLVQVTEVGVLQCWDACVFVQIQGCRCWNKRLHTPDSILYDPAQTKEACRGWQRQCEVPLYHKVQRVANGA